jgi:hypothetical protein
LGPGLSDIQIMTDVRKFYDCFGQEIESQTCAYCQDTKPIRVFKTESDLRTNPFAFDVLMREVTIDNDGESVWVCVDCLAEMKTN